MEDNIRKEEIKERFLYNEITDELLEYSVQEIIYLYSLVLEEMKKDTDSDEDMTIRKNKVFQAILFRIMRSEKIYVAVHVITGYPYADVKGNAWVFTEKEFANDAVHHYMRLGIPLMVKELSGTAEIFEGLFDLRRMGIETIAVDNGKLSVVIHRSDILREDELQTTDDYQNPDVMYSLLALNELGYASNGQHKDIPEMEKKLFRQIKAAKFLVPAKMAEHIPDGEVRKITDNVKVRLGMFINEKVNANFVTSFTDWKEFQKMYSKDEWNAVIMTFDELKTASEKCNGFTINPAGCGLVIDKREIEKISQA